jgi:hypothetical protein
MFLRSAKRGPVNCSQSLKDRYLRLSDRRTRHRLPIRLALAQAFDEGGTGRLARLRRRKEDLLQHRVALKLGIAGILREGSVYRGMMSSPPRGAVPTRIIRRKTDGRSSAICCATMPPSE